MIRRIDDFLSVARNFVLFLITCIVLASAYAFAFQSLDAHNRHVATRRARLHQQAIELAKKRAAWSAHLRREAWDRAHPEIIAQRKAAAKAKAEAQARADAAQQAAQRKKAAREAAEQRAAQEQQDKLAHACDTAMDYEKQAAKDLDSDAYQDAYDNATHGLNYNDSCGNDTQQIINQGYLLSMKGLAEHNLSAGDSRTDLNQANQLLVECQTTPGVYGTSTAAGCQTQEEYNIRAQTDWDVDSYDQ